MNRKDGSQRRINKYESEDDVEDESKDELRVISLFLVAGQYTLLGRKPN